MNTRKILIILIIIVTIAILSYAAFLLTTNKKTNTSVCQSLGCPQGSIYAGSVNSDKYYVCDCHYAKTIKKENIICFSSDSEATGKGYTKIDC